MTHLNRVKPNIQIPFKRTKADLKAHIMSLKYAADEAIENGWLHHANHLWDSLETLEAQYKQLFGENNNA